MSSLDPREEEVAAAAARLEAKGLLPAPAAPRGRAASERGEPRAAAVVAGAPGATALRVVAAAEAEETAAAAAQRRSAMAAQLPTLMALLLARTRRR